MKALSDLELLARLVSFDTTSATEQPTRPLGDMVCDYLDLPEVRIERFDCGNDQENIHIAAGPPCEDGEGLVLCGHVDCVPALEPEWESDPFELVQRGDRAFARGACDMKGFDAIAINLLRKRALAGDLREPLVLLLTCNEEIGTVGAGRFVEQWQGRPIPRRTVIGEPTSLKPIRAHKGHLSITIAIGGRGGHSGFPDSGVNAIECAIPVLDTLSALRRELAGEQLEWRGLFPTAGYPVLSIANIAGGSAINVIPEACLIKAGVRLLPGQDSTAFLPRLLAMLPGARQVERGELTQVREGEILVAVINDTPSFGTAADDPFLLEVIGLVDAAEDHGANYGTDAGRVQKLGCAPVVFGPGDISVAHKPNEWMPLDEFARTPELLERLVR